MLFLRKTQRIRPLYFIVFLTVILHAAPVLAGGDDLTDNLPQEQGPLEYLGQQTQRTSDYSDIYKQVLGMHNYLPTSNEYLFQTELIKNLVGREGSLPHLEFEEFSEVKKMNTVDGASNVGVYSAIYKGRRVVLKLNKVFQSKKTFFAR